MYRTKEDEIEQLEVESQKPKYTPLSLACVPYPLLCREEKVAEREREREKRERGPEDKESKERGRQRERESESSDTF